MRWGPGSPGPHGSLRYRIFVLTLFPPELFYWHIGVCRWCFSVCRDRCCGCSWNSRVERDRSPVSGRTTTMSLPAFSGRFATSTAAHSAPPQEIPTKMPSSRQSLRHLARVLGVHEDDLIQQFLAQDLRHEAGFPSLDLVRAGAAPADHRRILRPQRTSTVIVISGSSVSSCVRNEYASFACPPFIVKLVFAVFPPAAGSGRSPVQRSGPCVPRLSRFLSR
jgi:hypothetical protein